MAENKGFDLSALLGDMTKLTATRGQMQIVYLPYEQIRPDLGNGYSMDGIEELAGNIEMVGLLDPLDVRPEAFERYVLVSGHRRHAAIGRIIEGGSQMFAAGVPCIVTDAEADADPEVAGLLNELKLLLANADNRKKTSADEMREAEGLEEIVAKLSDLGFEFPGRRRDWVAKLSGMSKSKLARLNVIKKNLLPKVSKDFYRKGKMKESVAYALAKQDPVMQRIVDSYTAQGRSLEFLSESYVDEYTKLSGKFAGLKCKVNKGGLCINQDRLLGKCFDGTYSYKPCKHNLCCSDCDQYTHCRFRCPLMDAKAKAERDKKREESKDQKTAKKAQRDADIRSIENVWFRFGQALNAAGISDEKLRSSLKRGEASYNEFETYLGKDKTAALLDYSCTDVKNSDPMPFGYSFKVDVYRRLLAVADALDCSLDYLFLRTDAPEVNRGNVPESGTEDYSDPPALDWFTGKPPKPGCYAVRFKISETAPGEIQSFSRWDGFCWRGVRSGKKVEGMIAFQWYPIPEVIH